MSGDGLSGEQCTDVWVAATPGPKDSGAARQAQSDFVNTTRALAAA